MNLATGPGARRQLDGHTEDRAPQRGASPENLEAPLGRDAERPQGCRHTEGSVFGPPATARSDGIDSYTLIVEPKDHERAGRGFPFVALPFRPPWLVKIDRLGRPRMTQLPCDLLAERPRPA
jgi:hypothetical protein